MSTGDQCRGGEAVAKCQQMEPEVVRPSLTQYVTVSPGVHCSTERWPRGKSILNKSSFLSERLSMECWNYKQKLPTMDQMLRTRGF